MRAFAGSPAGTWHGNAEATHFRPPVLSMKPAYGWWICRSTVLSSSGSGAVLRGGPMEPTPNEITQLLKAWGGGDKTALDKLMPLVYNDLRRVARRHMELEREGHTLQTTALVHEAYLRLVDSQKATWTDRAHFFAVCARLMRQILVDSAR